MSVANNYALQGGFSAYEQLPLALIMIVSTAQDDTRYGSGAEARL
jgi:hypothetical protein